MRKNNKKNLFFLMLFFMIAFSHTVPESQALNIIPPHDLESNPNYWNLIPLDEIIWKVEDVSKEGSKTISNTSFFYKTTIADCSDSGFDKDQSPDLFCSSSLSLGTETLKIDFGLPFGIQSAFQNIFNLFKWTQGTDSRSYLIDNDGVAEVHLFENVTTPYPLQTTSLNVLYSEFWEYLEYYLNYAQEMGLDAYWNMEMKDYNELRNAHPSGLLTQLVPYSENSVSIERMPDRPYSRGFQFDISDINTINSDDPLENPAIFFDMGRKFEQKYVYRNESGGYDEDLFEFDLSLYIEEGNSFALDLIRLIGTTFREGINNDKGFLYNKSCFLTNEDRFTHEGSLSYLFKDGKIYSYEKPKYMEKVETEPDVYSVSVYENAYAGTLTEVCDFPMNEWFDFTLRIPVSFSGLTERLRGEFFINDQLKANPYINNSFPYFDFRFFQLSSIEASQPSNVYIDDFGNRTGTWKNIDGSPFRDDFHSLIQFLPYLAPELAFIFPTDFDFEVFEEAYGLIKPFIPRDRIEIPVMDNTEEEFEIYFDQDFLSDLYHYFVSSDRDLRYREGNVDYSFVYHVDKTISLMDYTEFKITYNDLGITRNISMTLLSTKSPYGSISSYKYSEGSPYLDNLNISVKDTEIISRLYNDPFPDQIEKEDYTIPFAKIIEIMFQSISLGRLTDLLIQNHQDIIYLYFGTLVSFSSLLSLVLYSKIRN